MQIAERQVLEGFIVLEGIDGTGTTTQLKRLAEGLTARNIPCWTSFEPSDLPTGQFVRRVLSGEVTARPETIARLFAADRFEHIHGEGGLFEHLRKGEIVIFDRYFFSSLAYQGMDCGLDETMRLNAGFPLPELLLYFDLDVQTAMSRVERRPGRDIYETHAALERVRAAYDAAIAPFRGGNMRVVHIDAALPLRDVSSAVDLALEAILARFERHTGSQTTGET